MFRIRPWSFTLEPSASCLVGGGLQHAAADVGRVEQPRRPTLAAPSHRAEVFETLVRLEKDFEARRVDKAAYETRREELIAELVSHDLALSPPGPVQPG